MAEPDNGTPQRLSFTQHSNVSLRETPLKLNQQIRTQRAAEYSGDKIWPLFPMRGFAQFQKSLCRRLVVFPPQPTRTENQAQRVLLAEKKSRQDKGHNVFSVVSRGSSG